MLFQGHCFFFGQEKMCHIKLKILFIHVDFTDDAHVSVCLKHYYLHFVHLILSYKFSFTQFLIYA